MKKTKWTREVKYAFGRHGGHFVPAHPLREVSEFFAELTDVGMMKALNLKFGPPRTHGSSESLRSRPRGAPGQGRASRIPRPQLLGEIQALRSYVGVKQTVRLG
jgi:hypothetical protein